MNLFQEQENKINPEIKVVYKKVNIEQKQKQACESELAINLGNQKDGEIEKKKKSEQFER